MDKDVARFIRSSFRSVWSLELVLLLRSQERVFTRAELISSLRASELVISNALEQLEAAGLVSVTEQAIRYTPVFPAVAAMMDRTNELYARRPDAVRRQIIAGAAGSLTAFADAFRLRED